ncbi:endonuclease [Sphingomonas sp. JC676]|uniref:endonuclease III domain-containing protein n=1 Tax=Sphingomonas sp. JC676 TaxID=2768065 RepID=UPI00165865BF|nr:endonuclease [Sphingomonas sp. JC676]MBC9034695.1 endonuclease [Sphingomonas sp. JC676]
MQLGFFGRGDLEHWRAGLAVLGTALPPRRRKPVGQLVKSLISGRTRDPVSLAAYHRLRDRFGSARGIAAAPVPLIEDVIADVTFADSKAKWLAAALRRIGREHPDFDLDFLGAPPLDDALAWLERLPGVGRKVAAATLNASTLGRPVFIVDSHVLRVLRRLGFVGPAAEAFAASEAVTAAMPHWTGDDFLGLHIAAKRLGQVACHVEVPACARCPLRRDCPSRD